MAHGERPDLVIGVDFGMSQTGVAYSVPPWNNTIPFQKWTNNTAESYDKVPTRLSYLRVTKHVRSWGFDVGASNNAIVVCDYFKLHLDPSYREYEGITRAEAKQWYRDYLACIHDHVARFFQNSYPEWDAMRVEWNFSVPTTWKHAGLVNELRPIMKDAGFGRDGPKHSCFVTLTEAEAAAISGAQQQIKRDDVILVCDAGGGTTDVNIMKVKSEIGEPLRVAQLIEVEGRDIGSALINLEVQRELAERLRPMQHVFFPRTVEEIAEEMMLGRFDRFKHDFGSPGSTAPRIRLPVPGLSPQSFYPELGIENSEMEVEQETIARHFDRHATAMINLIIEQLQHLKRKHPGEKLSYLILSGGLSASPYIQNRLKSHFLSSQRADISNARGMKILLATNLQLAVVRGLVKHRAQQLEINISPIVRRCAPVSYGVVVNQRYDPKVHLGQRVDRDKRDNKRWAIDQIEWLIRKGDEVTNEGMRRKFQAKLNPAQLHRPWKAQFVMSTCDVDDLPQSMAERETVREVCLISVNLAKVNKVVRNHHWWNSGPRYELAKFEVILVPGYADLKVILMSGNRVVNDDTDLIEVEWQTGMRAKLPGNLDAFDRPYVLNGSKRR